MNSIAKPELNIAMKRDSYIMNGRADRGGADMPENSRAIWLTNLDMPMIKLSHKISSRVTSHYAVHEHDFYELLYVVTGDISFFIAGHEYKVTGGTLLTFTPRVAHGVLVHSPEPYERYTLHFDPQVLTVERSFSLLSVMPDSSSVPSLEDEGNAFIWERMEQSGIAELLEAFEKLRDCDAETRNTVAPVYTEAILSALYMHAGIHRKPPQHNEHKVSTVQKELITYVNQHYTENVSLDTLGDRFRMSGGYVNALFKKATGQTVKDYVRCRRMAHARTLLASGVPSSQAAARTGFADYTTFYRAYVRHFGHAPSAEEAGTPGSAFLMEALAQEHEKFGDDSFLMWSDRKRAAAQDPAMYESDGKKG